MRSEIKGLILLGALLLLALAAMKCTGTPTVSSDKTSKGKYVLAAAGGCGCHGSNHAGYKDGNPHELPAAAPFGELFVGPFGSVGTANLTPDKDTGLGNWPDGGIVLAIRTGVAKGNVQLYPIMPYNSLHFMADEDVRNLVAYLQTVPALSNRVPNRQLGDPNVPPQPPLPDAPKTAPTNGVDRGQYLVTAVSICGDCHTPTNADGSPDQTRFLAGNLVPREGGQFQLAPNITPDKSTGLGNYTEDQIVAVLKKGIKANGQKAGGLMAIAVQGGFSQLTNDDAKAIAAYLKTIPAVNNTPRPPS